MNRIEIMQYLLRLATPYLYFSKFNLNLKEADQQQYNSEKLKDRLINMLFYL